MSFPALLATILASLAEFGSADQKENKIKLNKCCPINEMLAANGTLCIEAHWPPYPSIQTGPNGIVKPPLNDEWVRQWVPADLPLQNIIYVQSDTFVVNGVAMSVNASFFWDPALSATEDTWKNKIPFLEDETIIRPRPGGGFRVAEYCVDAAPRPLGPFAMLFRTHCTEEECVTKCCTNGKLLKKIEGHWECVDDNEGRFWTPQKTSLTVFDPEFPYKDDSQHRLYFYMRNSLRLSPAVDQYAYRAPQARGTLLFLFSSWDICFDFYNNSEEGLFCYEFSRVTRDVYWLLRPLCILSALLLMVSLISVAFDKNMRTKIHGRCLATYGACLFGFNIGQIAYYIALSDRIDEEDDAGTIPLELASVCKHFSLWMYFLLTASWFWLTALCVNMAMGFRIQARHPTMQNKKRFLALSAFAWGLPATLTTACSFLLAHDTGPHWYNPSLVETRVCYADYVGTFKSYIPDFAFVVSWRFVKSGAVLFYFGPMCCLVICNVICLCLTLRKVQYLKRGNSVLRREEDQIPLGTRHTEGNNSFTTHPSTGNGQTRSGRNGSGTTIDSKTFKIYIKMILMTGGIELLTEVIMWSTIPYEHGLNFYQDWHLSYRTTGYVTDFFRAAIVTWLAAPEGGYLTLVKRGLRRGKRERSSTRTGNAGKRKQNVA